MLPSVHRNVNVQIEAGPWIQAGLKYRPGVWRNCTNRGRGLLFEEIRYDCQRLMKIWLAVAASWWWLGLR